MAARTGEKTGILQTRVEEPLIEAVEQLRAGNGVETQAEMVRLLLRRGILAVATGDADPTSAERKGALSRRQASERVEGHVDAISDVIARLDVEDHASAVRLARRVAAASRSYARSLGTMDRATP